MPDLRLPPQSQNFVTHWQTSKLYSLLSVLQGCEQLARSLYTASVSINQRLMILPVCYNVTPAPDCKFDAQTEAQNMVLYVSV